MRRMMMVFLLASVSSGLAQSGQSAPNEQQLMAGAKRLFTDYLAAIAMNDVKKIVAFYHDAAQISVIRESGDGQRRTVVLSGAQYKKLASVVPNTEAPDRYLNPAYTVLKGGIVQISTQRQSVSRGYTAPNNFFIQPDSAGKFWIVAEQGIQKVK